MTLARTRQGDECHRSAVSSASGCGLCGGRSSGADCLRTTSAASTSRLRSSASAAETAASRAKVAEYFWRESGKWAQKKPPEAFGSLKFYGRWGGKLGFNPVIDESAMNERVGVELRRLLRRLRNAKDREQALKTGRRIKRRKGRSRGRDGLTVFDVNGVSIGPRLLECAERLAVDKVEAGIADHHLPPEVGPAWRALSEVAAPRRETDLADEPPADAYEDRDESDPEWEVEAQSRAHRRRTGRARRSNRRRMGAASADRPRSHGAWIAATSRAVAHSNRAPACVRTGAQGALAPAPGRTARRAVESPASERLVVRRARSRLADQATCHVFDAS